MSIWEKLRKSYERYQMAVAVRSLNRHAELFGFGPLTEEGWLDLSAVVASASRKTGVTTADAARAFELMGRSGGMGFINLRS